MAVATSLALLYYARAIHRVWLGAAADTVLPCEPKLATITLSVLMIAVVILGMFPGAIIWRLP
jgi:formate hydrogenlyase subunit 3/multisubunit Na+/H+ antiporter MnhD subunit